MGGKLGGQRLGAVAPGQLVHLVDEKTGDKFLVDTGAAFSVFPHHATTPSSGPALRGPSGQSIPCWGEKQLSLVFSGRMFKWSFLLAGVDFPIIGIDFLRAFRLTVDPAAGRLRLKKGGRDLTTVAACIPGPVLQQLPTPSTSSRPLADPCGSIAGAGHQEETTHRPPDSLGGNVAADKKLKTLPELLAAFEDVLNADGRLPPSTHGVLHHIVTSGPPVTAKFRRLEPVKLAAAKKSSLNWRETASSAGQTAAGPAHYIWLRKQTALGGHAAISGV